MLTYIHISISISISIYIYIYIFFFLRELYPLAVIHNLNHIRVIYCDKLVGAGDFLYVWYLQSYTKNAQTKADKFRIFIFIFIPYLFFKM